MKGQGINIQYVGIADFEHRDGKTHVVFEIKEGSQTALQIEVTVDRKYFRGSFPTVEEFDSLKNSLFNVSIDLVR